MTVDLKQIPDANRIGPSSAGLTHKGGSGQKEAGSRARRVPVGEGALPAASPLIPKPSPSALIWGKETSKGKFICPGTALGKPRANRAYRLPTERGRARHMPREGQPGKVMVPKAAHCSVRRRCKGATRPHLHIFFSFLFTLVLCHVESKPDLLRASSLPWY